MNQGSKLLTRLKEKIYCKLFQSSVRIGENSFSRERKLPFPLVISMLLRLVKKSLVIECELLSPNPEHIPPSKQAFSKSRYKISHKCFQEFLDDTLAGTYTQDPRYGTWRGYRVIDADDSLFRLPNSKEILQAFGRFKPNGTDGTMSPLGRV